MQFSLDVYTDKNPKIDDWLKGFKQNNYGFDYNPCPRKSNGADKNNHITAWDLTMYQALWEEMYKSFKDSLWNELPDVHWVMGCPKLLHLDLLPLNVCWLEAGFPWPFFCLNIEPCNGAACCGRAGRTQLRPSMRQNNISWLSCVFLCGWLSVCVSNMLVCFRPCC